MNEQKASWMSAEKLSFSTFLSLFFFFFLFLLSFMDQGDGPVPSLFMPSFTVRNRRKEKWDDIEK